MAPTTLADLFARSFETYPDRPALRVRRNGEWWQCSYAELSDRVEALAAGLIALGIQHGDRVGILSQNCPEWTIADLATVSIGAIVVPIYPSSTPDQIAYILGDSGAKALFVGAGEFAKAAQVTNRLDDLDALIAFDGVPEPVEGAAAYALAELTERTSETGSGGSASLAERRAAVHTDDLATIIYTSGTTGDPKGVMLTHGAFLFELEAVLKYFEITCEDSSLCFLPLSHAFERAWTWVVLSQGALNTYCLEPRKIAELMPEVRATTMVAVPKLFETVFKVAREKAGKSAVTRVLFDWALGVGWRAQHAGPFMPNLLRIKLAIADRLVLRNIREAIGGRKSVLAAGGAPLRKEVEEFFLAAGVLVSQGYGLTEAAPLISFNCPAAFRFGTVGRPIPGSEVRTGEDGEIQYRAPNVMRGYWNNPEATAEAITEDGWLRTGDVGEIDADGFLKITDRIKDLIVTAGGKNIAPAPIEGRLASDPLIEHAVVLGDNRPCLIALVRPSATELAELGRRLGLDSNDEEGLLVDERVLAELHGRVEAVSADLPAHEKIRHVTVIHDELTQDNGLLTPTLKVRRRAVEQRFAERIEEAYDHIAHRKR